MLDETKEFGGDEGFFEEGAAGLGEELTGAHAQGVAADEDHPVEQVGVGLLQTPV